MIAVLYRRLLLPAYEGVLKGRKVFQYWRELERTQWLSRRELEELQFVALRRLVSHAMANCPYYRETWSKAGLTPSQLQAPDDFRRWPVITREIILDNRRRMRTDALGVHLLHKSTGGSSGEPLHFDLDEGSNDRRTAAWHRGYGWAGADPGVRQLMLWGVPLGARPRWMLWKDRLYNGLYRRRVLNTFGLSEKSVSSYLEAHNRYQPDAVVAYAQSLYVFARLLEERQLVPFSPRAIVVGAEKLHDFHREVIERVFRAPVFETYGCREFMLIGGECERHEGFHLTTEHLLVEILDDDGRPTLAGDEGNVVVTDLYNYGMPFVRYANGDRAIAGWEACSCGRGLPLLRKVVGRRADVSRTPDGRHISGLFFPHLVKDFPEIRRFQVIQDRADHLELRLVVGPSWDGRMQTRLERSVLEILGPAMRLELNTVDDIRLSGAGKQQVVVNLCERNGYRPVAAGEAIQAGA
jgi:phenylacetate-CoA ligase